MTKVFDDGVLEATLYPNNWVYMRWVQNKHGRLQKTLIKDVNKIEQAILKVGLHGWFTQVDLVHEDFRRMVAKFGALPREIIGEDQLFVKPISKAEDLHKKVVV